MEINPELSLLKNAVRKERDSFLVLAFLLILGGIGSCLFMGWDNIPLAIMFGLLGMSLILFGFKTLYETLKNWDATNHQLIRIIVHTPENIVWVYSIVTRVSPFGINLFSRGIIFFKLLDKTEITLTVPARKLKTLSASLNPVLSHATFGYSQEREQWYIANPYLLLK